MLATREEMLNRKIASVVRYDGRRWTCLGYVARPAHLEGFHLAVSTAGGDGQHPYYRDGGRCLGGHSNAAGAADMIHERWPSYRR